MHVLNVGFSSFNKTWLSVWADDKLSDYITTEATDLLDRRDIYLGVYGGLGLAVILTYILGGLSVGFYLTFAFELSSFINLYYYL